MDAAALRAQFPVLEQVAYLNAGTDGPLPATAVRAASEELERELRDGRTGAHFERRRELTVALRESYARALGCDPGDVALTTCTSEGLAIVLGGLGLGPGDEILTSDEEHPGLLGAIQSVCERDGATAREVPLATIDQALGPKTAAVACSHVGWVSGLLAPEGLRDVGVPVVLDGAQGLGAMALDMRRLGCDAYAGAGQKWMCGPDGLGALFVSAPLRERLTVSRRGYANLAEPSAGLASPLHADSRRYDAMSLGAEAVALGLAAARVFEQAGWSEVFERAATLADDLAAMVERLGREVAPRSRTTLVSFTSPDPAAERVKLAGAGVALRDIPGRPWLRASVGAWNDASDLQRLVAAL